MWSLCWTWKEDCDYTVEQIGLVPISENTLKKQGSNKSYLCILTYRAFISYSFFSLFCGSIGSHFSVVLQMMDLVRLFCCFLSHQLVPLIDRWVTQFIMAYLLKTSMSWLPEITYTLWTLYNYEWRAILFQGESKLRVRKQTNSNSRIEENFLFDQYIIDLSETF